MNIFIEAEKYIIVTATLEYEAVCLGKETRDIVEILFVKGTKMLDIRMFETSDADILCPTAIDKTLRNEITKWRQAAKVNAVAGPAYTVINEAGELICAAGIRLVRSGIGNVWAVFSPQVRQHKKDILRWFKTMLPIIMEEFELKKLRTDSRKGFAVSQRFLEHIGFKRLRKETKSSYFYILEV